MRRISQKFEGWKKDNAVQDQSWVGYVISVKTDSFECILHDLTNKDNPDETAEITSKAVTDGEKLVVGMFFRWDIIDGRSRITSYRGKWTKEDIEWVREKQKGERR